MSSLEIHLLAGDPALLTPDLIHGQELAALCGPEFRCVPAYWLSLQCGRYSHNFLADDVDDNRIPVFARSLMTDYVRGPRPLLVIPALVDEPMLENHTRRNAWGAVLSNLANEISNLGGECSFSLHLLKLQIVDNSETKLEQLRNWLIAQGLTVRIAADAVKHLTSGTLQFDRLEHNFLSGQIAQELTERCKQHGILVEDARKMRKYVGRNLERWNKVGFKPALPLDGILMDRLTEAMIAEATGLVFSSERRKA